MTAALPRPHGFAEKLVGDLAGALALADEAESLGTRRGLLQGLDPRVKLAGTLALIIGGVLTHSLATLAGLLALALALAACSRLAAAQALRRVWLGVLLFTGAIAVPALVLVPGEALWHLPFGDWAVTRQGLRSAAFLVGRAETSATLMLLLIASTPWTHLLKAMRSLGAPVALVAVLGMTHRYVFVLLHSALQACEARRSRLMAPLDGRQRRRLAVAAAGALLDRSFQLATDVHLAMVSRGYRGETRLLDDFRTRPRDWLALALALAVPALIVGTER